MHSALHALFGRRRSILPARDIFDAELDRARTKPGCTLCRLVLDFDQHEMHSLLWEYCTDPHVGSQISQSWGYCSYHTWALAMVEHERLGGGLGISMLYQPLLKQFLRLLFADSTSGTRNRSPLFTVHPPQIGSTRCRLCQLVRREETQFLVRLTHRMTPAPAGNTPQSQELLKMVLCLPHIHKALATGTAEITSRRSLLRIKWGNDNAGNSRRKHSTQPRIDESFFYELTQQYATQINEIADDTRNGWRTIARQVALLAGGYSALPLNLQTSAFNQQHQQAEQAGSFLPLLLTGKRSQLHSPAESACPLCVAAATALTRYIHIFDTEHVTLESHDFCASHYWLLAGLMTTHADPQQIAHYRSWMQKQLAHMLEVRANAEQTRQSAASIVSHPCIACQHEIEDGRRTIDAFLKHMRLPHEVKAIDDSTLLCLMHWQAILRQNSGASDDSAIEARLLLHQRARLSQLDEAVEAYITSFNAAKRERGDIPDVPGAAWAWERLLAFFAGEPGVILPSFVSIQLE